MEARLPWQRQQRSMPSHHGDGINDQANVPWILSLNEVPETHSMSLSVFFSSNIWRKMGGRGAGSDLLQVHQQLTSTEGLENEKHSHLDE